MWIAGKWVDTESGRRYPGFNPATAEEIAQLPLGDKNEVNQAVAADRKAFPVWTTKPQAERSQIAMTIAAALRVALRGPEGYRIGLRFDRIKVFADRRDTLHMTIG